MESQAKVKKHSGSCHCGAVRFEAEVDATAAGRCNCSVCTKIGATASIVKPSAFRLLTDEQALGVYVWGGKISQRFFCKTCGVHAFAKGHLAELGGDYVSVNFNALDDVELGDVEVGYWDGRHNNWQGGLRKAPWPTHTPQPLGPMEAPVLAPAAASAEAE